jgi:hypothetical protein
MDYISCGSHLPNATLMKRIFLFFLPAIFSASAFAQLPLYEWADYSTGTAGVSTYAYSSCYDHSGNSFVLGAFNNQNGTLDLDPSSDSVLLNGYVGMWIAKYDPAGQMVWGKQIQITTMQVQSSVTPRNITCDDSGNVYITGAVVDVYIDFDLDNASNPIDTTSGGYDLFLAKYSAAGNLSWSLVLGSTAHEEGNSLAFFGDKLYMVGQYGCNTDFDPGPGTHVPPITQLCVSGFLACYTTNGDFVWQNSYCGPSLSDAGYGIAQTVRMDSNHDLIICGRLGGVVDLNTGIGLDTLSVQPTGGADGFFAKFDTSGNFIFAKALVTVSDYMFQYMDLDKDDNIIIAGSFNGIVDFDPSPAVYTDTAMNYSLNTGTDGFIAKYDNNGNFLWEKSFGTTETEDIGTIATDTAGHILIGGQFTDPFDADFGPGVYTLTDVNNGSLVLDGFTVKYDENGNFIFGFVVSGFAYDYVGSVACYNDKIITTGKFSQAWDFDPTAAVQMIPAVTTNGNNYFHVQYYDSALVAGVPRVDREISTINVFPVPAATTILIEFITLENSSVEVAIYSCDGKIVAVQNSQATNKTISVDISSLTEGTYIAQITHDGITESKVIVVAPED